MRVNLYGGVTAKDGDTLQGAFKLGMMGSLSSQVGPVKDPRPFCIRVDSLMSNANKIVDDQNRAEIKALLSNLNKTVAALQTTAGSVNNLVGHK
jgi:phospholipid/cholesterol/gamma-HCH transport system substrate-binding protein